MSLNAVDKAFLLAAVERAGAGIFSASPNPRVGCLLVKDGEVVGRGAHLRAGGAHAEVLALRDAGDRAHGSTAYVSLEPCRVTGRTGPCTEALIEAGVSRVVSALIDPDPRMKGRGLKQLREAGISVINARLPSAIKMNEGYLKRLGKGLPWVRVKMAMSLDGRTAMASGESRWITSEAARRDVQYWRARSCALITGTGTVVADDPQLNVRNESYAVEGQLRQPLRVVMTTGGEVGQNAKLFDDPASSLLVAGSLPEERRRQWLERGVDVLVTESSQAQPEALLRNLANRGCNEVLIEAGARLAGSFVRAGLWDEIIIYLAPRLLGSRARALFELPLDEMGEALGGHIADLRMMGPDVRLTLVK